MPQLGHFQDDGLYWVCAKSLARGAGYRIESLPGTPYQTKYPPLFPLLLAGVWKLNPSFPDNLRLATLAAWLMLPLFLLLAKLWLDCAGLDGRIGWALLGLLALNPYVVFFSMTLMPELLFTALLLACLMCTESAGSRNRPALALAAGVLGAVAYLVKSSALPLVATAPLCFLLRRQARSAAAFVAGMAPAVVAWSLWSRAHMTQTTDLVRLYYTDYVGFHRLTVGLGDLPLVVWQNLTSLLAGIGGLLVFSLSSSAGSRILLTALGVAAISGVVRMTRGGFGLQYPLFAAGFSLQLALWNFPPNERFLIPLFPLLAAGFAREARHVLDMLRASVRTASLGGRVPAVLAALGVTAFLVLAAHADLVALGKFLPGVEARAAAAASCNRPLYAWISRNLPADATILAYYDPVVYLHTGRASARPILLSMPHYRGDFKAMRQPFESLSGYARQHGLDYFLLTALDYSHGELAWGDFAALEKLVQSDGGLEPVYRSATATLYRVAR